MTLAAQTGLSVVADGLTVTVPAGRAGRERRTLLEHVSFRIEPGEFICVLGPSGAGKSTFVKCLLGEREIASGRLLVGGHDVFREADALRGAIGYVDFSGGMDTRSTPQATAKRWTWPWPRDRSILSFWT